MANQVYINDYFETSVTTPSGVRAIKIADGEAVYKIKHGAINGGSSASLELLNDDIDYQTSGTAKVVLIIFGSATTLTDFEIIEDTTVNLGTGTQKEDFPAVSMSATLLVTSKVLSFAASKYITIKVNTGNVGAVLGYVVE